MVAFLISILLLALLAELVHLWRCARLRDLLFHGCHFPWATVSTLAAVRLAGLVLIAMAVINLWNVPSLAALNSNNNDEETDRVLILLDCSRSMDLDDGGSARDMSRGTRAAHIIRDLLHGNEADIAARRKLPRTSLVVFANKITPLVIDTNDWNVLWHSLNNRGLSEALFDDETTKLGEVLNRAFKSYAATWPDRSTTLLLITDGDSEDRIDEFKLPPSIRRSVVIGVGSSEGRVIGATQSRLGDKTLQEIARALGGRYFNGNETPVPPELLGRKQATAEELAANTDEDAVPEISGGKRPIFDLILLGLGITLLTAATLAGPFLNPSKARPKLHGTPAFLS